MRHIFVVFILTILAFSAFSQRRTDYKTQLKKAPGNDPGYILLSDENGEFDAALLHDLMPIGIDTAYCTADSCFMVDTEGTTYFTGLAQCKVFRFSSDNFATVEPASPPLTVGTAGYDRRRGCRAYFNGSTWSYRGLFNGEEADVPFSVVGNDSLVGWNVSTHSRGQLTISSLEPDSVWIPRPIHYLTPPPGSKIVVDVWNNQLGDTLTVFFDTIFRKFNQELLVRYSVPPKARLQFTFKVNPSAEGAAWVCTDGLYANDAASSLSNIEWLARQKFDAFDPNPPVSRIVGDTTFERMLDAKYLYIPGSTEERMYFLSIVSGPHGYRYISSFDHGKTWSWPTYQPAFFTALGSGDEVGLHESYILPLDSVNWRMYYQSIDGAGVIRTKLATTANAGVTWTRLGVVLDVGATGQWDATYAGCRNVIKLKDNTYYMAYEGTNGGVLSGGVATSHDGIMWTKKGKVVEMEPATYGWENNNGLINYVQQVGGVYVMMYGTKQINSGVQYLGRKIGIAYSTDGVHYTKYSENPIIDLDTFIVNTAGGWNQGTEDFISWEKIPGQEGGYSITTRGRPVYSGGSMKWNFGLYRLGDRIDSKDVSSAIYDAMTDVLTLVRNGVKDLTVSIPTDTIPPATNIGHTWFVSSTGTNATAIEGDIFKPVLSPFYVASIAHVGDVVNVFKGTYQAGVNPAFSSTNPLSHGLARTDSLFYNFDMGANITAPLNYSQSFTIATDIDNATSFTSSAKRVFGIGGYPSIYMSSTGSGVKAPFGFYNPGSEIYLDINNLINTGSGRNWAIQTGCRRATINVNNIETSGGFALSVASANDAIGVVSSYQKRYAEFNVKSLKVGGNSTDYYGAIVYSSTTKDSLSSIIFNIGNLELAATSTRRGFLQFSGNGSKDSYFRFNFGNIIQKGNALTTNTYTSGLANSGVDLTFSSGMLTNCEVEVNINNIVSPRCMTGTFAANTDSLVNSTLLINIKKGTWSGGAPFIIEGLKLRQNTKLIINCDDCKHTGTSSMFWISNCDIDATSSIEIRGTYRVTGARPVINTRNTIVLNGATLINDGTVAAVQSDAPTSIVVRSAHTNAVASDPDVTELVQFINKNPFVK